MIYKDLISNIIGKDKTIDVSLKNSLVNYVQNLSNYIHVVLEPTTEELSLWKTGLTDTKINLHGFSGIGNKMVKLHDDTFLVFRTNMPALQYSKDGSLIRQLPFEYGIVDDMNTSYQNVIDVKEVIFSDISVSPAKPTTIIAVVMSGVHTVRFYKYTDSTWTYISSLGEANNPGNTSDLLDTPIAVGLQIINDTNTLKIEIIVSNAGVAPNTEDSFLKYFKTSLSGAIEGSPSVINYPGINGTSNTGSLLASETSNINNIVLDNNVLYLSSSTEDEFGVMKLNSNLTLQTMYMKKDSIQTLSNGDVLNIPVSINKSDNGILAVDPLGHLFLIPNDFTSVKKYIGITKPTGSLVDIPFYFSSIQDLRTIGNDVYILSDNNIHKIDFLEWNQKEFVFSLSPLHVGYKIEYLEGFTDKGDIYLSLDNESFMPVQSFVCFNQYVSATQFLYIKIVCTEDKFLEAPKIKSGILILSPCL